MDKSWLVEQLVCHLRQTAAVARREGEAAAEEAQEGASPSEKREDARVALEYSGLARGQMRRAAKALADVALLERFRPQPLGARAAVSLGAIIEIEDPDAGEGRTLFLAPAGAGVELDLPGGDGFLSVVTPLSPIGRAVIGRRVGDVVDVLVEGETREWEITFVA